MCYRYQQFRSLRKEIKQILPDMADIPFPQKQWFFNLSDSILRQRSIAFKNYLDAIIAVTPQPVELGGEFR